MHYPYNAIFDRGLLNTFEAALHSTYLCLKVLVLLGVISIHGSQKNTKNIEQGFAPGHRNVNCLQDPSTPKAKAGTGGKAAIEHECETKRVSLDPRVSNKIMMIA
jgi:hypothetical protein